MGNDQENSNTTIHHMENSDGTKITERVDIANRFAQEISKNSSSNNYHTKLKKYQVNAEKNTWILIQTTLKTTMYNLPLENYVML